MSSFKTSARAFSNNHTNSIVVVSCHATNPRGDSNAKSNARVRTVLIAIPSLANALVSLVSKATDAS